jgi:hypothetical protein
MDLTVRLYNLPERFQNLLNLPLVGHSGHRTDRSPEFPVRDYQQWLETIVAVLAQERSGLRLAELYARVSATLDRPIDRAAFRKYVNAQTRRARPPLEHLGRGLYAIRR